MGVDGAAQDGHHNRKGRKLFCPHTCGKQYSVFTAGSPITNMPDTYHVVRDPVHGFIKLNDTEQRIIGTKAFERLHYVRQLAMTYLAYPGAEHSRFAHSLGVMNFATRMFDALIEKHQHDLKWDQTRVARNRQLLRLAALLHDTGHAPFSHASEDVLPLKDHEEYSVKVILSDPVAGLINDGFQKLAITAEDVANFFSAENIDKDVAFLKEIYSGEIDADKLDYLQRDSLFTGVHYGRFDYERLIYSLTLIKDPREKFGNFILAIEPGGLHSLEGMVLARYFMFTQVYFHKIRRAFDHHLVEFLKKYIGKYPEDLGEYLNYDDNAVFHLLRKNANDPNAARILERKPYKEAFTTDEHIDEAHRIKFMWMWERVSKQFGNDVFYDAAEKAPHKFKKVETYVINKTTGIPALVQQQSGIISSLKKIEQYRVFTDERYRKDVNAFCLKEWATLGKPKAETIATA